MHLIAGLTAGSSIAIMCFTGVALSFESDLVAWAERNARRVTPPAPDAVRQPLQDLLKKVREAQPDVRPAGIVLSADPKAAVAFTLGRDGAVYANPYTGEIRSPASTRMRDFMRTMTDWHRYLAVGGDNRPIGKAINGACNLVFLVLAISGLYLWLPRSWSWRGVKAVVLFNWRLTGKPRDFNWHNVIGLWCAPIFIGLTLTAVPIAYRWGGNLIYQLAGEEPPVLQGPGQAAETAVEIKRPNPDSRPLSYDALVVVAQQQVPRWETITLRLGNAQRGGARGQNASRPAADNPGAMPAPREASPSTDQPRRESRSGPPPVTVAIKEPGSWPRTATTTLTLNPFTGELLKREGFADLSTGRRIRTWTRFLHTGEALGRPGQFIAGLACLGGCFLVYTGFALSWRRFFGKRPKAVSAA